MSEVGAAFLILFNFNNLRVYKKTQPHSQKTHPIVALILPVPWLIRKLHRAIEPTSKDCDFGAGHDLNISIAKLLTSVDTFDWF